MQNVLASTVYKILKMPFFGRFMVKWVNPLSNAEMEKWQTLNVKSKSGALIKGLFARCENQVVKATIVFGHPMGKEAKGYFLKNGYTELMLNNGFNVIIFDINGFGESTHGNFSYYEDIIAIGNKAFELTPHLPIGYHGISLGGQWATIAFTDKTHRYNFAILESAATTLEEFWKIYPVAFKALSILSFLLPKYSKKIKMIDRIKEVKNLKSLLFIYSAADAFTPVSMGERFRKNTPIPSELWIVQTAKHASIMKSEHKAEYEQRLLSFIDLAIK